VCPARPAAPGAARAARTSSAGRRFHAGRLCLGAAIGMGLLWAAVLAPPARALTAAADWPALAAALAGERLDHAIYNAGVFGSRSGSAEPPSREEFDAVMQSNVFGAMHALAALAPQIEASGGTLAFVTSQMGSIADAASSYGWVYRASKAALNMAVHSAARERRCTLLLLHPGWVRTDMGGANATLDVATSVAGLRRVIAGATTADNGKFFNYTGKELPW
ncbi:MAG: SDR family NAD(P)-dependent oxidoreductase, partial [Betaproteobacteria bacterium]